MYTNRLAPTAPSIARLIRLSLVGLPETDAARFCELAVSSCAAESFAVERSVSWETVSARVLGDSTGETAHILVGEIAADQAAPVAQIVRLEAKNPALVVILTGDGLAARESELQASLVASRGVVLLERPFKSFELNQLLRLIVRFLPGGSDVSAIPAAPRKPSNPLRDHHAEHDGDAAQSRWALERVVSQALLESKSNKTPSALCIFGIDRLHAMLDRFGAAAQSSILRNVRRCIDDTIQPHHRLLRIGEDEFGVAMAATTAKECQAFADKALQEVRNARLHWRGVDVALTASAGITDTSHEEQTVTEFLLAADTALQAARASGGDRSRVYLSNDSVLVRLREQSSVLAEIESALAAGRFRLFAQLIVPTNPNEAVGAELLVRMIDRSGSLVLPGKFLLAAERFGIAPRIDRWVVDRALSMLAQWGPIPGLGHVSINLSGHTLVDAAALEWIEARFQAAALPPKSVCFEITETAAIDRWTVAATFIDRLRAKGALFSLDDFGAGFSSFTYLESVHADFLKIDGSFIRNCTSDPRRLELVRALNEIGHLFGKRTVAEFVETDEVLRAVTGMGIDYAQGYFSGMPFEADNLPVAVRDLPRARRA